MGYANHLIDRCVIYRYGEHIDDDGVTRHNPKKLYENVPCRLIQRNTRDMDEHGRTKIISAYTLLLMSGTDIVAGDLVHVNGEIINEKPVRYEASKAYSPNRHHIRVTLNEEVER